MFEYDYFEEYSEFDAQIEEFKESLRNQVKEEIKSKIDRLEKRNKELEERQKNLATLEKEYKDKIRKLERDKEEALLDVKKEYLNSHLQELMEQMFKCQDLYEIGKNFVKQDKCPHCDEDRRLLVKDMFGREHKILCKCYDNLYEYYVRKAEVRIYVNKKVGGSIYFRVKINTDSYGYDSSIFEYINGKVEQNNIFEKFDENNLPRSYCVTCFTSKEEAQKYADYLNKKEKSENV